MVHDGQLIEPELAQHAKNCYECRELAQRVSQLYGVIDNEKSMQPTPFLLTRIMEAIPHEEVHPANRFVSTLRPVLVAASLLFVVWFGIKTGSYFPVNDSVDSQSSELVYFDDASMEGLEFLTLE
jgi:predicted anti-sigma-YlaC factor YlaD